MGELTTQLSSWPGALDTGLSLTDAVDAPKASHINGIVDAVLKMQADLGIGLKGSVADLRTRIAVNIAEAGGVPSGTVFPGVPTPQQLFWRTDTKELSIYDDIIGQWQRVDSSGVHAALSGLLANDHPQYPQKASTETITGGWTFSTAPSLPAGSITSADIADGTITSADIADGTITSADIADGTIVDGDISSSAAISEVKLSANLARLNASAPFTADQLIQKLLPTLELLESGAGTKKARFFQFQDGSVYVTYNASTDGAGIWSRDDVAASAWLQRLGGTGNDTYSIFRAPLGANPISWTEVFAIDSAGVQTIGTGVTGAVKINRMFTHTYSAGNLSFASITLPDNLAVGDIVHVFGYHKTAVPGTTGATFTVVLQETGTAGGVWEPKGDIHFDHELQVDNEVSVSGVFRCTGAGTGSFSLTPNPSGGTAVNNISATHFKA